MVRVYYIGEERRKDNRLPGVTLTFGQAVDVPEALARKLLRSKLYSLEMADEPVRVVKATARAEEPGGEEEDQ